MFKWLLITGLAIIIIFFASLRYYKKRLARAERRVYEFWERLVLRNPTEKELQEIIMTTELLQEKAAQKLLEIGVEKVSFLLVSIFGKSCDEAGWKKYLEEEDTCVGDLRWVISDSKNPKIKEHAAKIMLAHCKDLLIEGNYDSLSYFKGALRDVAKHVPSQKENAELFMIETREEIIRKIRAIC